MAKINKSKRNKQNADTDEDIFTVLPVNEDVQSEVDLEEEVAEHDAVVEELLEDILDIVRIQDQDLTVDVIDVIDGEVVATVEVEVIDDGSDVASVEIVNLSELDQLLVDLKDVLTHKELLHYTIDQLKEYVNTGKRQSKTPRGNYKVSRTRSIDVERWTVSELEDWAEGRIEAPQSLTDDLIMEEIYSRWKIPANWTYASVRDYLKSHTLPVTTTSGELVHDRRREACDLDDMTFAMLCSIHLGEVETRHSAEDALNRIKVVIRSTSDDDVDAAIEQYLSGRTLMSNKIEQLLSVLDARKKLFKDHGTQLTENTIAINQKVFYTHLRNICKLDYAEFAEAWRSLLRYMDNNYNELFIATRIRRGWGSMDLSQGNLATFDRLLTLAIGTRNGATRHEDVKSLKMDYILEFITNSKERENISAFYQS